MPTTRQNITPRNLREEVEWLTHKKISAIPSSKELKSIVFDLIERQICIDSIIEDKTIFPSFSAQTFTYMINDYMALRDNEAIAVIMRSEHVKNYLATNPEVAYNLIIRSITTNIPELVAEITNCAAHMLAQDEIKLFNIISGKSGAVLQFIKNYDIKKVIPDYLEQKSPKKTLEIMKKLDVSVLKELNSSCKEYFDKALAELTDTDVSELYNQGNVNFLMFLDQHSAQDMDELLETYPKQVAKAASKNPTKVKFAIKAFKGMPNKVVDLFIKHLDETSQDKLCEAMFNYMLALDDKEIANFIESISSQLLNLLRDHNQDKLVSVFDRIERDEKVAIISDLLLNSNKQGSVATILALDPDFEEGLSNPEIVELIKSASSARAPSEAFEALQESGLLVLHQDKEDGTFNDMSEVYSDSLVTVLAHLLNNAEFSSAKLLSEELAEFFIEHYNDIGAKIDGTPFAKCAFHRHNNFAHLRPEVQSHDLIAIENFPYLVRAQDTCKDYDAYVNDRLYGLTLYRANYESVTCVDINVLYEQHKEREALAKARAETGGMSQEEVIEIRRIIEEKQTGETQEASSAPGYVSLGASGLVTAASVGMLVTTIAGGAEAFTLARGPNKRGSKEDTANYEAAKSKYMLVSLASAAITTAIWATMEKINSLVDSMFPSSNTPEEQKNPSATWNHDDGAQTAGDINEPPAEEL